MRPRIACKSANSLALDATYVYAAAGANVFRLRSTISKCC
jgi:hypothetical protein